MSEEEIYDPLSQVQKHMMLKNGMFEFDTFKPGTCCCNHSVAEHLDCTSICLSKELCICERFLDKESNLTTVPTKQGGKLPQKQKQKEQIGEKSNQMGYIQTLALNIREGQRW